MYDINKLHDKELEILLHIHEACEKMNLRYVIICGTLLGAIRHKGFIPWDDDVDICMPREDYDIFIRDGEKYLPKNLTIQHFSKEKECPNIYAKVRDNKTTFLASEHIGLSINQGVFVDIFPIECVSKDEKALKREVTIRRLYNRINYCYDISFVNTIKRKRSIFIAKCIRLFIIKGILHGVSKNEFMQREDKRRLKKHKENINQDGIISYIDGIYAYDYQKLFIREKVKFCDNEVWAPKYYDDILKGLYGDYMKLPPEDKRIQHNPLYVDLKRGIDEIPSDELEKIINKQN